MGRPLVSPLRGFKTRFDHDFLGLAPQAIDFRRSAADLRNFKTRKRFLSRAEPKCIRAAFDFSRRLAKTENLAKGCG